MKKKPIPLDDSDVPAPEIIIPKNAKPFWVVSSYPELEPERNYFESSDPEEPLYYLCRVQRRTKAQAQRLLRSLAYPDSTFVVKVTPEAWLKVLNEDLKDPVFQEDSLDQDEPMKFVYE